MTLKITAALHIVLVISLMQIGFSASEWKVWNDSQYKIHIGQVRDYASYENATESCKAENATLTSICSKEEEEQLITWITDITKSDRFDVWIGRECNGSNTYCNTPSNWHWTDGKNCNYQNWHRTKLRSPNEPSSRDTKTALGGQEKGKTIAWFGEKKETRLDGCVCKTGSSGACRDGWKCWGSAQYKIIWRNMAYTNAHTACQSENAELASICSEKEEEQLAKWLAAEREEFNVCIGYQCTTLERLSQTIFQWHWTDESACNYTNWHRIKDEPMRGDRKTRIRSAGNRNNTRWFGTGITNIKYDGYICKKGKAGILPTQETITSIHDIDVQLTSRISSAATTSPSSVIQERTTVTVSQISDQSRMSPNQATSTADRHVTATISNKSERLEPYATQKMTVAKQSAATSVSTRADPPELLPTHTTATVDKPVDKPESNIIIGLIVGALFFLIFGLMCLVFDIIMWKRLKAKSAANVDGEEQTVQHHSDATYILGIFKRIFCCKFKPCCRSQYIREYYRRRLRRNHAAVNHSRDAPEINELQEMKPIEKRQQMSGNGAGAGIPMQLKYRRVRPGGMNQPPNVRMMLPRGRMPHPHIGNRHGKMVGRGQYPSIRPQHANIRPLHTNIRSQHPRIRGNLPDGAEVMLFKPPQDSDRKVTMEEMKNNLPSILEDKKISEEFKSINVDAGFPRTAGKDPRNMKKNRFQNVLPYDYSRVKLHGKEMDYFNASYIDAGKPKAFIATQGPKMDGLCDFWYMIWQEKVNVIVMVTNLIEGKQRKCHQYWPDQMKTAKYEEILVKCMSTQNTKDATVRCFMAKRENQIRKIWQFHFRTWPDAQVPLFTNALLNFWAKLKGALRASRSPVVVHCSAGIGRTGTFIALDILLDEMQMFKAVDVHRCITNLRKQRPYMVQNIEQYKFLYKALHNWVTLGPTWLHCQSFNDTLPTLFKPRGQEPPRAVSQFLHIEKKKKMTTKNPQAINEENAKKNRSQNILPEPQFSVKLKTEVAGRNDYLNAIIIDGYLSPNAYIATQAPLEDTKIDFWRMVLDTSCSVLVSLVTPGQMKPEEIYFPQDKGETIIITPFTITCKNNMGGNDIAIRHLAVAYSGKERVVQHLCINQPLVPKTAAPLICKLCHLTNRWLQLFPKSRAVVHCLDGATWTGVFCAALNIFHQINSEGAVDIMDVIQNLRIRSDTFIRNQAQYNLLFNLVQVYLNRPKSPSQQPLHMR